MAIKFTLLALLLSLTGCAHVQPQPPSEHTGMGTVRKIANSFWDAPTITHVTDSGYVKVLSPVCYGGLNYVVEGMREDISFHWLTGHGAGECYKIDGVLEAR